MMKLNDFQCAQSSSANHWRLTASSNSNKPESNKTGSLHNAACWAQGNVSCSKAGKICIWGCTPSSWGQSPVWLLSNSNRISHFSSFSLLSLVLSSSAFSAWYCVRLGQRWFPALSSSAEQQLLPAAFPFVKQWISAQTFAGHVGLSPECNPAGFTPLLECHDQRLFLACSIISWSTASWQIKHCAVHLSQKHQIGHFRCSLILQTLPACFSNSWLLFPSTLSYSYVNITSPATLAKYC